MSEQCCGDLSKRMQVFAKSKAAECAPMPGVLHEKASVSPIGTHVTAVQTFFSLPNFYISISHQNI